MTATKYDVLFLAILKYLELPQNSKSIKSSSFMRQQYGLGEKTGLKLCYDLFSLKER